MKLRLYLQSELNQDLWVYRGHYMENVEKRGILLSPFKDAHVVTLL